MAVELDVQCHSQTAPEEIVHGCHRIFKTRFHLKESQNIVLENHSPDCFFLGIAPDARVLVMYHTVPEVVGYGEEELWANIDMTPYRTPQSFLLAAAIAIVLAEANKAKILDEVGLLGLGQGSVDPDRLQFAGYPGDFDQMAEAFARDRGVFQWKNRLRPPDHSS